MDVDMSPKIMLFTLALLSADLCLASNPEAIPRWTGRMLLDNRLHQPIVMGYLAGVADAGQGRIWCDKGAVKTGEIDAAILEGLRKLPSAELEKNGAMLINDFLKNKYPCLH